MESSSLAPLRGFLRGARGRSQEQIIIEFLDMVVNVDLSADHGSVMINHSRQKKLVLFNEGDFLFRRNLLDSTKRGQWPAEFTYYEGVAGRCFRYKTTQVFDKDKLDKAEFVGSSPICNMVCIPIITNHADPFGVVCLHNDDSTRKFSKEQIDRLEAYVDVLALALHTPHPELQLEKNVFIVHGRDTDALRDLELVLRRKGVTPKVLADEDKSAQNLLSALEDLIRICKAGFILATPDDEGRLVLTGNEAPSARARENVILETGLLFAKYREFGRVSILLKKPVKLPSDLNGVAYDEFTNIQELEAKIDVKLRNWCLI